MGEGVKAGKKVINLLGVAPQRQLNITCRFRFFITVPPMIWVPEQLISVYSGESVRLTCVVEAHPASLNYWEKVNKHYFCRDLKG